METPNQNLLVVYKATSPSNKVYIGITTRGFHERYLQHKRDHKKECFKKYPFYAALNKYGFDSFEWEIIDTAESKEELLELEKFWIDYYDSATNQGYNATTGGDCNFHFSEETKKRMSIAAQNRPKRNHSPETLEKLSEAAKNRDFLVVEKQKIRCIENYIKYKDKLHSPEARIKAAASNTGKKRTPEQVSSITSGIRKAKCKRIICLETKKIYNSMTEAYKDTGVQISHISTMCRNAIYGNVIVNKSKGLSFAYLDQVLESSNAATA